MKQAFHKRLRRLAKQYSKRRARFAKHHPYFMPVSAFLILFFLSCVAFVRFNAVTVGASDTRVVIVYADGEERSILTRAETVGQMLKKMNIEIGADDVVEPAIETEIYDDNFRVTVYRARPVIVDDSGKRTVVYTTHQSAELIAERSGIKIYPEDKIKIDRSEDVLSDGIVAEKVVIDRATPVSINLYGNQIVARTHAETVGDVIDEKDIQLLEGDTLQPGAEAVISDNLSIFIVRTGKQIVSTEEPIPFETEVTPDGNQLAGVEQITEAGVLGKRLVTYELDLENGQEVARRELQSVIAEQPKIQKVIRGTKVVYSNPSANVELGKQIAAEMGFSDQFDCIYSIYERESHWNHLARNRSSGAYGIPQALPGSKMGPGWESDPAVQIRWGIGYMVSRYGSPCQAQAFWNINHWY